MSAFYVLAGVMHFVRPSFYEAIMPPFLAGYDLVMISGVCEVLLGLLLLLPSCRRLAAWGIILLLVAIFPANVQMAVNYYREHHPLLWIALVRLPLQIPLIWWAHKFTSPSS
jgi:uncharacterized membrane protein